MTVHVQSGPPDAKTRKYDRQLRLWAATGQAALEDARLLVIGGTATSSSILKNLVLPGIGHFTILDPNTVAPEDVGNNFFLEVSSIGKAKAVEITRFLSELNDSVDSAAEVNDIADILAENPSFIDSYTLVIAHNLPRATVDKLAEYLWSVPSRPPLIVVKTAGFLAEFYIQCHEHTVIDSHPEDKPSLRIDQPFPSLLERSTSIDFATLDQTDHGHVPFVYILVNAAEKWKESHDGKVPQNYKEKQEFKKFVESMKVKSDEENFDEAVGQAYRVTAGPSIPHAIRSLFNDPRLTEPLTEESPPFFHLLAALKEYASRSSQTLPLSASLPDMKADTKSYVEIQTVYKDQARRERDEFAKILDERGRPKSIDDSLIDDFVKNAHGLRILRSQKYGDLDKDTAKIGSLLQESLGPIATHLAFASYDRIGKERPTAEELKAEALKIIGDQGLVTDEVDTALNLATGELARAATADLPTTAGFVGGLVAQEAIKLITRQYVPQVGGYVAVDLVKSWTGVVA